MTKAEQIIEKLNGEQKIIYGGIDKKANMQAIEVIPPKPILIGDVLEQFYETILARVKNPDTDDALRSVITHTMPIKREELVILWSNCGANKSLQEIAEDIEKGELGERVGDCPDGCKKNHQHGKFRTHGLVSLQASALIDFLHSIFITE